MTKIQIDTCDEGHTNASEAKFGVASQLSHSKRVGSICFLFLFWIETQRHVPQLDNH